MKKTVIAVGVIASIVGGAFFANNAMIAEVANKVTITFEKQFYTLNSQFVDVQLIDSNIEGNRVNQRFAVYFKEGSNRHPEPLYVNHKALISPFGYSVDGYITLPKDKGLTAEFIKEVTSFNERISYNLDTYKQSIDLNSNFVLGDINPNRNSRIKLGKVNFDLKGTLDDYRTTTVIDGLTISERKDNLRLGKVSLSTINSPTYHETELNLYEGGFLDSSDGINFQDVKFKTTVNIQDNTGIGLNWEVGSLNLNSPKVSFLATRVGLSGQLEGLETDTLLALGEAVTNNNEAELESLTKLLLGNGMTLSELNLFLNDSKMSGSVVLNKGNYENLQDSEIENLLGRSISSDLDITITPKLAQVLQISAPFLDQYWNKNEVDNYYTKFQLALGKATMNGIPMN